MAKNRKGRAKKAADKVKSITSNKNLPLPDPPPPPKERPNSQHRQQREPLKQLPSAQSNATMMRRNNWNGKPAQPAVKVSARYGTEESVKRLERDGFDSRVTALTLQESFEQWSKIAEVQSSKLTSEQSGPAGHSTHQITNVSLLIRLSLRSPLMHAGPPVAYIAILYRQSRAHRSSAADSGTRGPGAPCQHGASR